MIRLKLVNELNLAFVLFVEWKKWKKNKQTSAQTHFIVAIHRTLFAESNER